MSIEEILMSAESHGKRTEVLNTVSSLKLLETNLTREELYEKAYEIVMKV